MHITNLLYIEIKLHIIHHKFEGNHIPIMCHFTHTIIFDERCLFVLDMYNHFEGHIFLKYMTLERYYIYKRKEWSLVSSYFVALNRILPCHKHSNDNYRHFRSKILQFYQNIYGLKLGVSLIKGESLGRHVGKNIKILNDGFPTLTSKDPILYFYFFW
jgi:hypothetical protein